MKNISHLFFVYPFILFFSFYFLVSRIVLGGNIFQDGFETGNFTNWTSTSTNGGSGTASITADNSIQYQGSYSARAEVTNGATGGFALARKQISWPSGNKLWYTCYIRVSDVDHTYAAMGGIYVMESYVEGSLYYGRADLEIPYPYGGAQLEEGQELSDSTFLLRMAYRGRNGSREGHRQSTMVQAPARETWHKLTMLVDWSGEYPVYAWWLNGRFIWQDTDTSTPNNNYDDPPTHFYAGITNVDWGEGNKALVWIDNCSVDDTGPSPGQNEDTTPPTISSVSAITTSSTASISWTTDEGSSSQIEYGLSSSYGSSTQEMDTSPRVTAHSVSLAGLVACTTYHYRVKSKDSSLNEAVGEDETFTTSGCSGSASVVSQNSENISSSSGGSLALTLGGKGITLTIPAGFSESDANFQIKKLEENSVIDATSIPTGYSLVGSYIYDLRALTDVSNSLSSFDKAITLSITYDDNDISGIDESSLKIFRWDGEKWNQLSNCNVNPSSKNVSCTTAAFSVFGLFGQAPTPTPTPTPTSTPTPTLTSSSSSSSNPSSVFTTASSQACGDSPPGSKAPWLYGAIAQDDQSILLYFTAADGPVDKYVLEYGTEPGSYQYGVQDMKINSSGQMTFLVKSLLSNTTYYFRVRGGNGCAVGPWSNEISAKTKSSSLFSGPKIVKTEITGIPKEGVGKDEEEAKTAQTTEEEVESKYVVRVKVVDPNKNPLEGVRVVIHSEVHEAITDKSGIAEFKDIEPGEHKITINYKNYQGEESVYLSGDYKEFDINITIERKESYLIYAVAVLGGVVIILLFLLLRKTISK